MDFMSDQLADGQRFRLLTLVDNHSRESLAIEAGQRLTGDDVVRVLEHVTAERGKPRSIRVDHGHDFISRSLDQRASFNGVKLDFSRPGKPTDNAVIESFNGKLRDECLNQHWFLSLDEARSLTESWREDYNRVRPHASLGHRTPFEFARRVDGHAHLPALSGERLGWIRDGGRLNVPQLSHEHWYKNWKGTNVGAGGELILGVLRQIDSRAHFPWLSCDEHRPRDRRYPE